MCLGKPHTPIVSQAQRGLFGMIASGKKKLKGLSEEEAKRHLKEVLGKPLPKRV